MDGRICRLEVGSVVGHFIGHNVWLRNGSTKLGQSEPFFGIFQTNSSGQMFFWRGPMLPFLWKKPIFVCRSRTHALRQAAAQDGVHPDQISVSGIHHPQGQLHFCHIQHYGSVFLSFCEELPQDLSNRLSFSLF